MKAITFCVLLATALSSPVDQEFDWSQVVSKNIYYNPEGAEPIPVDPRVIGGTEETPHASPHSAGLFIDGYSFCGGSLISQNYVLTAAHCCEGAGQIDVVLGAHKIREAEPTQVTISSREFNIHPEWNRANLINDLCLISLPQAAPLNSNIGIINLAPPSSGTFAEKLAKLAGWGRTSDASSSISPVLMKVEFPVLTNSDCEAAFGGIVQPTHICTSGEGTKGGCNGDSGSALVIDGQQVGIVSFGSSWCEAGYPTAYTRVSSFAEWISQNSDVSLMF